MAAWRAVLQYVWNPYHWEKTTHGVVRRRVAPTRRGSPSGPANSHHR